MSYAGDLTPAEAWELLQTNPRAVLVDVRTPNEWREIGIPDTSGIGRNPLFVQWVSAQGEVNPNFVTEVQTAAREQLGGQDPEQVIVLCRSGARSIAAATALTAHGAGPAYNVLQGFEGVPNSQGERNINGWRNNGLPSTTW